jgi:hypothetical protein
MSAYRAFVEFWFDRGGMSRKRCSPPLSLCLLEDRLVPSDLTAGASGINARNLDLTGKGVAIGQVELGRPGLPGFDKPENSNAGVKPAAVYQENKAAVKDKDIAAHSEGVAGIMIYNGAKDNGVAPGASLYSTTFVALDYEPPAKGADEKEADYEKRITAILVDKAVVTTQALAQPKDKAPVRAINISTVLSSEALGNPALDGSFLLSAAVDYLTVKYDTLFVLGKGNADAGATGPPADSFNSLVVGGLEGVGFDRVGEFNDLKTLGANDRRLIDVLAPGVVALPVAGKADFSPEQKGTSYAAPHVTATVALLQQYAVANKATLTADAQNHLVMKAVIMNSANVIDGRLGQTKTVTKTDKTTWDKSDARDEKGNEAKGQALPIDQELGTGAADAGRAKTQLSARNDPKTPKPVAWDYATATLAQVGGNGDTRYTLPTLKGGSWVEATLTWDRQVKLNDKKGGTEGMFDPGESFTVQPLADLDLFLVKKGDDPSKALWASTATGYNIEHILFQLPAGDQQYELVVRQKTVGSTPFALAWWSEAAPEPKPDPKPLPGLVWNDLNQSGVFSATDPVFSNVRVDLHDATTGAVLDSRYTDANGAYQFTVDSTGQYYVTVAAPTGYTFSPQDAAANVPGTVDSDVDPSGQSGLISASSPDWEVDAGLFLTPGSASLGGQVWEDLNGDGTQDPGEPTVSGATVALEDPSGNVLQTTTSASDGSYSFTNVAPGDYQVSFTPPTGYTVEGSSTLDVSAYAGSTISDLSTGLVRSDSVGGIVWSDTNGNGIQDPSETGMADVQVQLLAADGTIMGDTATDANGAYSFTGLLPGTYSVRFFPPGATDVLSPEYQGTNSALASDADPGTGLSAPFDLTSGAALTGLDAGLSPNTPPQAAGATAVTNQDAAVTVPVLAGATDPDGDVLSVIGASNGNNGATAVNADGTVTYTPNPTWNGVDTFTYTVGDGLYGSDATATVTVTVNPVTQENTPVNIDLSAFVVGSPTSPTGLTYTLSNPQNGTVALSSDGHTVLFTPNAGYFGTASFGFTATDLTSGFSTSGTVSVIVTSVTIAPPVAGPVSASTTAGSPTTINVLSAASDPNGFPLTVVSASGTSGLGTVALNSNGTVTYTPKPGFVGTDTFTYTVDNGHGGRAIGTVTVAVYLPPWSPSVAASTPANTPVTIPTVYFDQNGAPLVPTSVSQPAVGSVTLNSAGLFVYTPPSGFQGMVSFSYTVSDGYGHTATVTVTISVFGAVPAGV